MVDILVAKCHTYAKVTSMMEGEKQVISVISPRNHDRRLQSLSVTKKLFLNEIYIPIKLAHHHLRIIILLFDLKTYIHLTEKGKQGAGWQLLLEGAQCLPTKDTTASTGVLNFGALGLAS